MLFKTYFKQHESFLLEDGENFPEICSQMPAKGQHGKDMLITPTSALLLTYCSSFPLRLKLHCAGMLCSLDTLSKLSCDTVIKDFADMYP